MMPILRASHPTSDETRPLSLVRRRSSARIAAGLLGYCSDTCAVVGASGMRDDATAGAP